MSIELTARFLYTVESVATLVFLVAAFILVSMSHVFTHCLVRRTLRRGYVPDRLRNRFDWWSFHACFRFLTLLVFQCGTDPSGKLKESAIR